ncbi:hypothetical protein WISP_36923 [Willisornis vidua]|uniref:Uncharacterized protein n=1 Tax=Willisornis vidua TaxID=1566151 RepID=A0ABQ9DNZ5_9PASS|nr:hypothetical protein WISP_36923 [Willisornis vidua]
MLQPSGAGLLKMKVPSDSKLLHKIGLYFLAKRLQYCLSNSAEWMKDKVTIQHVDSMSLLAAQCKNCLYLTLEETPRTKSGHQIGRDRTGIKKLEQEKHGKITQCTGFHHRSDSSVDPDAVATEACCFLLLDPSIPRATWQFPRQPPVE